MISSFCEEEIEAVKKNGNGGKTYFYKACRGCGRYGGDMAVSSRQNQNMMNLIRKVHGLVERPDLTKHRQSQDRIGAILGTEKGIAYEETEVDGMSCEWVKVERAHLKRYVILYCHGGGYSTGSTVYARTLTTKLAESTGMDVFCFNYRLAPECKFPAAAEDAMKAWNYLMYLGYGARDVIVAGDSAGGNLALSLTLKLKEEGRMLPRGLALMSPWTDLTKSGKSYQTRSSVDPVLDHEYLDRMIENYAGGMELTNPYISPLFGKLEGLPPVYIQVGDNELLFSDSTQLHKNLVKADVSARIDIYKGMWHVFQMSPLKNAYDAMNKIAEFIFDICR